MPCDPVKSAFQKNRLHRLAWLHGIDILDAGQTRQSYGRHVHCGFAIGAIRHGVGGNWYRGESHVLPAQSLTLMNPDEPHTGHDLSQGLAYTMMYVSESAIAALLGHRQIRGFRELAPRDPQAVQQIAALSDAVNGHCPGPARRMLIEERVHGVLGLIFGRYGAQTPRPGGAEPMAIRRVKEMIDAHIETQADTALGIADMARAVGLKPNYLIQSFSRSSGISPHAYLIARKICRAKDLLAQGHSAAAIAVALGFYDQSHFIRHFRKITGVTPGAMRIDHHS